MVHRAQRPGIAVGGHISSFASSASLYEVGFNHFFKGHDHPGGADQIFIQGHASPVLMQEPFWKEEFLKRKWIRSVKKSHVRPEVFPLIHTQD